MNDTPESDMKASIINLAQAIAQARREGADAEREACAKLADGYPRDRTQLLGTDGNLIALAIRHRGDCDD